jgi:glycosyltransferase involved in cell wall biosynthesis
MSINNKIRVLNITYFDIYGGAAKAAYRLHIALNAIDRTSIMLVTRKDSKDENIVTISQPFVKDGFKKISDKLIRKIYSLLKKNYLYDFISKDKINISEIIKKESIDIIHFHWFPSGYLNIEKLNKIKAPIVWTLHDSSPFTGICHIPYNCKKYLIECDACPLLRSEKHDLSNKVFLRKKKLYERTKINIVSPSNWLAEAANKSALFRDQVIQVIPNGININIFQNINKQVAKRALSLGSNKLVLLFGAVSLKDENKGFRHFLSALGELKNHFGYDDIEILIIGDNLDRTTDYFKFNNLGFIKDERYLSLIYSASDVTVVPSISENFSNTILESMSCATPVVAFDIGGNSDLIDHKTTGYLATPFDNNDLALGIRWCLDKERHNSLSEKSRKKVEENFNIDLIVNKYQNLYKSLLSGIS